MRNPSGLRGSDRHGRSMGMKSPAVRDWMQIYAIYGTDEWQLVAFLTLSAAAFGVSALVILLYFAPLLAVLPDLPLPLLRLAAGFAGSFAALSTICLLYAACSVLRSSLILRWDMAQRMVAAVPDWSAVRNALDVGCGRGILLNAVAARMKKERTGGRVVGLDRRRDTAVAVLRRAWVEGVQEYVTCRDGDTQALPFADGYFDVVVSALLAEDRGRGIEEMVRVLKPGGIGVVWDLVCVPEYAQRLREMRMEDVRVSERVTAFLVSSHIVSFRKPLAAPAPAPAPAPTPDEWWANIC